MPLLLKHRFSKRYRHSTLDASLTRARITGEARALLRCLRCYDFFSDFVWLRTEVACSCGVSVPGLRFVDAANGVLGIEWVNGRSARFLLGSGDEGEETDSNEDGVVADEDSLEEYGVSKGMISHSLHLRTQIFSWDGSRSIDDDGRHRDSKDAPRGYHTWRPHNVEHDAPSSIFHPRLTRGDATVGART